MHIFVCVLFLLMSPCVICVSACLLRTTAPRGHKRLCGPRELDLQVFMSHTTWMPESELVSSERTGSAFNQ